MRRSTAQVALRHEWLKVTDEDTEDVRSDWKAGLAHLSRSRPFPPFFFSSLCAVGGHRISSSCLVSLVPQLYKRLARVSSGTREARPGRDGGASGQDRPKGRQGTTASSGTESNADSLAKGMSKMKLETAML
jgi:hypothetical protein